ncbi:MAG TPA: DinB family protein [Candidatus Dormibacteraeota bacterium]
MEERSERPDDYIVLLAQVPERIADLVAGLDEEQLRHRHAPAFPTLEEMVAHLAHAGTLADSLFRQVLIDGRREVDLMAALDPSPPERPSPEVLDGFARDRRRTADLLRGLRDPQWEEVVIDRQLGDLTVLDICERVGRHEAGHLTQLRNLLALLPEHRDLGPLHRDP